MTRGNRRRLVLSAAIALLLSASVLLPPLEASYFDFEQITVDATAGGKGFTAAKITPTTGPPPMQTADCRVRTAEISFLVVDPAKTAVTASVGQLLEPGDRLYISSREEMLNFRAIRTGGTSGQLDCWYKAVP